MEKNLGGIKDMEALPDALFVIDTKHEHIAVNEANRLGIPVVAVVDTNCDPDVVDYPIPGNDDAIRAIQLFTSRIADSVMEGLHAMVEGRADTAAALAGRGPAGKTRRAKRARCLRSARRSKSSTRPSSTANARNTVPGSRGPWPEAIQGAVTRQSRGHRAA